jgi:hypothetical protein
MSKPPAFPALAVALALAVPSAAEAAELRLSVAGTTKEAGAPTAVLRLRGPAPAGALRLAAVAPTDPCPRRPPTGTVRGKRGQRSLRTSLTPAPNAIEDGQTKLCGWLTTGNEVRLGPVARRAAADETGLLDLGDDLGERQPWMYAALGVFLAFCGWRGQRRQRRQAAHPVLGGLPVAAKPPAVSERCIPLGRTLGGRRHRYALSPELLRQHALILGASGVGKTNLLGLLLNGLGGAGVGALVIDLKGDAALARLVRQIDPHAHVFTIGGSTTWDPLAHGDATALRDALLEMERWSEPHYQQAASRYLNAILGALQAAGELRGLAEVVPFLEAPDTANGLVRRASQAGDERAAQALQRAVALLAEDRSLRSGVQGLGNRLAVLVDSPSVGAQLAPHPHGVDLDYALTGGGLVLFSLAAPTYPAEAPALGALVAGLSMARAGELAHHGELRCQLVIDECAQLAGTQVLRATQMGRSLGFGVVLATQELSDLDRLGAKEPIWANTALTLVGRQDVPASADFISKSIGTHWITHETQHFEAHDAINALVPQRFKAPDRRTFSETEERVVHPNVLTGLRTGQFLALERWPQSWHGLIATQLLQ